ncbi:RAD50-interacting protein 1-like [Montipora capricornis]|uniref:RAD50-interacting protein 1-like n=1 Tax=Montipora capricornis TaxID=246305 RepID=UPI0035F1D963
MANEPVVELELSKEVTHFLNKKIGTEKATASKVFSLLQNAVEKKNRLEVELQDAQCKIPSKIENVLDQGSSAMKEIKSLQQEHEILTTKVNSHLQKLQPLTEKLSCLVSQIIEVERFRAYVSWIQKIESVSCEIHQFMENGQITWAVEQLSVLSELARLLQNSSCCNLTKFVNEMLLHWQKILLNKLASEFDEIMKALKWPFTSLSTAPPLSTSSDDYRKLENVFILLLKLQNFKRTSLAKPEVQRDILLPLDWLLKPLRKRFHFHFYGNKQTNNPEKPEWYFTQVLNWIKNHSDFLQHTIQPILQRTEFGLVDAKTEFISGLLEIIGKKLEHSIPQVFDDDNLFSHLIDELLLFNKELLLVHGYQSSEHNNYCLHILTNDACIRRWVELEKKSASSNLELVLSSSSAWSTKYKDVVSADDTRTPECAEAFMILLSVMTDRYINLPDICHQELFLDVQLSLLESFINRLTLKEVENSCTPTGPHYCSVLNAANYIEIILQEWNEQVLFLKLHQHQASCIVSTNYMNSANAECPPLDGKREEEELAAVGSIFHVPLQSLKDLKEHMIYVIRKDVLQGFCMLSKPYKKEKWHTFPPPKDVLIMSLSSSACEMMLFLKGRLQILQEQLAGSIFNILWKDLSQALNKFIFEEIILHCHFNEGGAAQLQFDLTKNLFTLFLEYTQKPENFFKEVKEACILLNLLPGSAVLLRDLLKSSETTENEREGDPSSSVALQDTGVYRLTPEDALKVLDLRIHLPNVK